MPAVPMAALHVQMFKTKPTSWGVASSLHLCLDHSLLHIHPLAEYCLFLGISLNVLLQEPICPPLPEICFRWAPPTPSHGLLGVVIAGIHDQKINNIKIGIH